MDEEGFTDIGKAERNIKFLVGNAQTLDPANSSRLLQTSTIGLANKNDILIFWLCGMRENQFKDIEGYDRVILAAKPGLSGTHCAGVGMWIKKNSGIIIKNKKSYAKKYFQAIIVETSYFKIFSFYRSPNQDANEITKIIDFFEKNAELDTIITGDLNLGEIDWPIGEFKKKSDVKSELAKTLILNFRKQFVTFGTYRKIQGRILDIIIGHGDLNIKCTPEENTPGCNHIWIQMEYKTEKNDKPEVKKITKKTTD